MKLFRFTGLLCLAAVAFAQSTHFDYDRSANFSAFKTYQWVDSPSGDGPNQLMDQNIKRAVDSQLASKGMQRVESGADVQISYQAAIDEEREFDVWGAGPRFWAGGRVASSTIQVGKLVINIIDPARKQLVWRGEAEKTLDIKKDPDKNFQNLQKTMAKLFQHYPPSKVG